MSNRKIFALVFAGALSMVWTGCRNEATTPKQAEAQAASFLQSADSVSSPEVIDSGTIIGCRNAGVGSLYYCAWRSDNNGGRSIPGADLSFSSMPPGTAVDLVRLSYLRYGAQLGDNPKDFYFVKPQGKK